MSLGNGDLATNFELVENSDETFCIDNEVRINIHSGYTLVALDN